MYLKPGHIPPAGTAATPPAPRAVFNLPNCRVGVAFQARVSGNDGTGAALVVTSMDIPPELGLLFDPGTQQVTGTPAQDGEFQLALQWRHADSSESHAGRCHLIVNPDPKSLWKVIEPAPGQPFARPHTDSLLLAADGVRMLAASRRGRSHEHAGAFRDDDFFIAHDASSGWRVMLVADGAGSAGHSREGARLAVTCAGRSMLAQLSAAPGQRLAEANLHWDEGGAQMAGSAAHDMFLAAAGAAVDAIDAQAQQLGASPRDFATTLLAVACRREGDHLTVASFWMGDGAIGVYGPRGTVRVMGEPDSGEYAGQTRFLDRAAVMDAGFARRVRIGRFASADAIILMTDGVSDPYFETDNGLADGARWDVLWDALAPLLAGPAPQLAVLDWLHFFRPGHHDDRTIAVLW